MAKKKAKKKVTKKKVVKKVTPKKKTTKKTTKKKAVKKKAPAVDDSKVESVIKKQLSEGPKNHQELRLVLGHSKNNPALSRTLQRLRRQGKLQTVKGRWTLSGCAKLCPECGGKGWVE